MSFNNKLRKSIRGINQLACLLICIWIAYPYFQYQVGLSFLFFILIVWLLSCDIKWVVKKWPLDLYAVFIFFATFLPYIFTGNLQYGASGANMILVNFPIFFLGIFINHYYMYYKKDYQTLGRIAAITLLFFAIGSLQTYLGLRMHPLASRILATANDYNILERQYYADLGIGGYHYIYSASLLVIAALYPLAKKKYKLLALVAVLSILIMVLKASYAIAILMMFAGITLVLLVRSKKVFIIVFVCLFSILTLLPEHLGNLLLNCADLIDGNSILHEKLTDMALSFMYDSLGGQTAARINYYSMSLKSFLSQPLFGIYGPFGDSNSLIGGHSGWLDLLAFYGLFTGIPLVLVLLYNFRKTLRFYGRTDYFKYVLTIQILFLMLGGINPVLNVFQLGFVLFCVVPALPFIKFSFSHKERDGTDEDIMVS